MRLFLALVILSVSLGAVNAKESYPECLDKFPIIKGAWITNQGEISTDTLKAFNRLNFLGAFALYGRKATDLEGCKDGQATVSTSLFDSFSEDDKGFIGCSLRLFNNSWCGAKNQLSALPSFYLSAIKSVQQKYSEEAELSDIYFTYPLLAINEVIRGNLTTAREKLQKIKSPCSEEVYNGTTHPAKAGGCWKRFDESPFQDPGRMYGTLDDINEIIEDQGIVYETGKYDEIRMQSTKFKGTKVKFKITVMTAYPGEQSNYINAYVGSFSTQPQMYSRPGPRFGEMFTELDEISSREDSPRVIIRVPESLSGGLARLTMGDIITIKGKANGLKIWSAEVGRVPLITAEKIVE